MSQNKDTSSNIEKYGNVCDDIQIFIEELNVQYNELKKKIIFCEQNIYDTKKKIDDIKEKIDRNYDYFSTSQNKSSIEIENLKINLDIFKKNLKDYLAQESVIKTKIDKVNNINNYFNFMNYEASITHSNEGKCNIVNLGVQVLETLEMNKQELLEIYMIQRFRI